MDQSQWSSYWRSYLSPQGDVIEEEDAQMTIPMYPHHDDIDSSCPASEFTPSSSSIPESGSGNSSVFSRGTRSTGESTGESYARSSQSPSREERQTLEGTRPASHASNLAHYGSYPAPIRPTSPSPFMGMSPADLGTHGMTMESLRLRLQNLYRNLQSSQLMPQYQRLVDLQKDLQDLTSDVNAFIRQTSAPVPPTPAESPARYRPRKRSQDVYKCHSCQNDARARAVFKRHL